MRTLVWVAVGLVLSHSAFGDEVAPVPPASNVIEEFVIERDGDQLLLPVTVDGVDCRFIVATMAKTTILNSALDTPIATDSTQDVKEKPTEKSRQTPKIFVGESRLPVTDNAFRFDLTYGGKIGIDYDGVLGMNFLRSYVVHINFDAGKLSLLKLVPPGSGDEFPLSKDRNGLPTFRVSGWLDGENVTFVPATEKTGDITGGLDATLFDRLDETGRIRVINNAGYGIDPAKKVSTITGDIDIFKFGMFSHPGLRFEKSSGNYLGLGYLSRFIVTFDFPNNRMYLKPGNQFERKEVQSNASGIAVFRSFKQAHAVGVAMQSEAYRQGLRPGDRIVSVDGIDPATISQLKILRRFEKKGPMELVAQRDGQTLIIRLGSSHAESPMELDLPEDGNPK